MSDTAIPTTEVTPEATTAAPAPSAPTVTFTEKEERVLKVVWQCLKTVPDVDIPKLTKVAGFNTEKVRRR